MSSLTLRTVISLSLLTTSALAQSSYQNDYDSTGLAGGGIAGVVIGVLVLIAFLSICGLICYRRRRATRLAAATPSRFGGGMYGYGNSAQAPTYAGYGEPGWNNNAQGGTLGGYKPPPGMLPGYAPTYGNDTLYMPEVGTFAPPPGRPPAAHTRL